MGSSPEGYIAWGFPWSSEEQDEWEEKTGFEDHYVALHKKKGVWSHDEVDIHYVGCAEWSDNDRFVYVKESRLWAMSGQPLTFNPADLKEKPEWLAQLTDYCQLMDIEVKEPGWHLMSNDG